MKIKLLAMLSCLTLLAGCAGQPSGDTAAAGENSRASAGESADVPEEPAADGSAESLFEIMPGEFMLCSGAGAWSTTLTIVEDGTFAGLFHDSDAGVADPGKFPDGTRYVCQFTGSFTQPEKISDHVYSMEIETLELEHPADGTEEYADGVRYIYSGPYGLEEAGELRIYLPDTPVEELPEGAIWAARGPYNWQETAEGTLGLYEIYNVNEDLGFVEYPRGTGEELTS